MTSRWSAAGRPGSPPPSMRPPKDCRSPCSTRARSAARPAPARRIENYLGFPTGISGQALAGRAFNQAQKFGANMLIPVSIQSLDCSRADGAFRAGDRMRKEHARQIRRGGERGALSPARDRKSRDIRGARRLVLGLADRGQAVRRPGCRAGRRRQFGRAGRGVPVRPCPQGLHDHPRRRARGQHVALSDRAHRGDRQYRTDVQRRSGRPRRR